MDIASYIAGILSFVLATIFRFIMHKNVDATESRFRSLFSRPSKNYPEDIFVAMGQFLGVLWIATGIFLTVADKWLSSSVVGIIAEAFVPFMPFLVIGLILRRLIPKNAQKK